MVMSYSYSNGSSNQPLAVNIYINRHKMLRHVATHKKVANLNSIKLTQVTKFINQFDIRLILLSSYSTTTTYTMPRVDT